MILPTERVNVMHIYKITNLVTKDTYVGKTTGDITKRLKKHISDSKNKKTILHRAIQKYGVDNFTIELLETVTRKTLDTHEIAWISKLNPRYNMTAGGDGGNTTGGRIWITDGKQDKLISKRDVIYEGWRKGRSTGAFVNPDIQKELSSRVDREANKYKIQAAWTEEKRKTRSRLYTGRVGIKHTEETKAKMSIAGKKQSEDRSRRLKERWDNGTMKMRQCKKSLSTQ